MLLLFYDSLIYPRFTRNVGFHFTQIIKNILCPCLCGNKFQALDETERTAHYCQAQSTVKSKAFWSLILFLHF